MSDRLTFYEFFAGGGMARAGLGSRWKCLFANDFDPKKAASYRANWGEAELWVGDVHEVPHMLHRLPGRADLAWASFPCQDLSLAGNLSGLSGARSSAFWGFHETLLALSFEGRLPHAVVVENVTGLLTANGGADFQQVVKSLDLLGYANGALVMDAKHFLPQSRPRLFILAVRRSLGLPSRAIASSPVPVWSTAALTRAHANLPRHLQANWRWWNVPVPAHARAQLGDLLEQEPKDTSWHTGTETTRLVSMMSEPSLQRIRIAKEKGGTHFGTVYRRTRPDETGAKVQRAELRMDGLAGCLRTPGGGSSRQFLIAVEDGRVRSRLISAREAARLMGLPDSYVLPSNYNDAYHLAGDGLAVPAVSHVGAFLADMLTAPGALVLEAAE